MIFIIWELACWMSCDMEVMRLTGAWKLDIRFWNATKIPTDIRPSMIEKPPSAMTTAPLTPLRAAGTKLMNWL